MPSNYAKTSIEGLDWGIVTQEVVGPSGHIGGWVAVLSPPVEGGQLYSLVKIKFIINLCPVPPWTKRSRTSHQMF